MITDLLPLADLQAVTLGYLLGALEAGGRYAYAPTPALPATTIHVEERGCVLSVMTAPAPLFSEGPVLLASELCYDVALLRVVAIDHDHVRLAVNVALGLRLGSACSMRDLEPWCDRDGAFWFVPRAFGPSIAVDADGFHLELVPPYHTLIERETGVLRAADDLAQLWRHAGREAR